MDDLSDRIRRSESEILDHINDLVGLEEEIGEKMGKLYSLAVSYYTLLESGAESGEISVSKGEVAEFKRYLKETEDEITRLYKPITGFRNKLLVLRQKTPLANPPE
jgi:hypothetical protein